MKVPIPVAAVILSVFIPAISVAQGLQSGALLTITSSDGLVKRAVYDSQFQDSPS
jgi:hypothetical protein